MLLNLESISRKKKDISIKVQLGFSGVCHECCEAHILAKSCFAISQHYDFVNLLSKIVGIFYYLNKIKSQGSLLVK